MKREPLLVLLLTVAAIALRLAAARDMGYWDDDLGTLYQARRIDSLATFFAATGDGHPPLSFVFTKLWLAVAGLSGKPGEELAIRTPFIVIGTLAVPLAWALARRMTERSAVLVAALVAAHPLLAWSDRDIRCYALLVPLALAATLFWLRAQETSSKKDWVGFVFFSALACWDHYNAIPFVGTLLLLAFFEGRRREAIFAGLAVLALLAAWIPSMVDHMGQIHFREHQKNVQLAIPPVVLTAPCYVLFGMVLGYTVFPWNFLVVLPAALAASALALRALKSRRALVLGLVLPVLGAAATPFKMPRYWVASVPFLLILFALGAERTRRGATLFVALLAAMLFSDLELLSGREHHFLFPQHPWREAARIVRADPAPVLAPPGPFASLYVPDLIVDAAPATSACWLLVDEKTTEEKERAETALLEAHGFRKAEAGDLALLVDLDHEARARWVHRGTREKVVRLVRFVK